MQQKYDDQYINKIRGRVTEDQLLKHVVELKEKRSITPETHKSRILIQDKEKLTDFALIKDLKIAKKQISEEESMLSQQETDHQFYVDEYQYKDNAVLRFGINKYCNGLKEELNIHNSNQTEFSGKKLETLSNISQETKYKEFSSLIKLTNLEEKILVCAIDYLKNNTTVKTILVDLFPRGVKTNDKGLIDVPKDEPVDTHTVVLYNSNKKILIIDPNNPQFSAHLSNFDLEIFEATYTPNNQYKIYSRPEKTKTGYNKKEWRDCIDIAVKLAFGLNNDPNVYKSINEVMSSGTIKLITNNSIIDKFFPDIKNIPFRSKQSSDLEVIKNKNKVFESSWNKKLESEQHQVSSFNPIIKSIEESLKITKETLQSNLGNIKITYEKELAGLDNDYFDEI